MNKTYRAGRLNMVIKDEINVDSEMLNIEVGQAIVDSVNTYHRDLVDISFIKKVHHMTILIKVRDEDTDSKFYELYEKLNWDMFEYDFFRVRIEPQGRELKTEDLHNIKRKLASGINNDLRRRELYSNKDFVLDVRVDVAYS